MKKKGRILLFALLAVFMLAGWGKQEVRLLDSSKLIDLNKAIEMAKPGGRAGTSKDGSKNLSGNDASEAGKGTASGNRKNNMDKVPENITIRIRGEQISYICGTVRRDDLPVTQLENRIRQDYVSGVKVTLNDDFAEAHVYKAVLGVLDGLKSSIGLNYDEASFAGGVSDP